jgi:pimeloyl-ACP methyl ester carboxylesterase
VTTARRDGRRLRVLDADPLDEVRSSFVRLAERFRPEEARGLDAAWVIEIQGRSPMTVHVREGRCLVSVGAAEDPVARLRTDEETWLSLVTGRQDGIAAFLAGRLRIEGDLNLAARFETMFRPGPEATRLLRTVETQVRGVHLESIVSGAGTPVVLLHGLGANKVSFLPTLDGLSERFEVHALDLPGFGKSGKPLPTGRRYTMPWMADIVHGYLVRNGIRDAHVVGNSMGGRIAIELGLRHPRSVRSIVGLGAAVAFDEYQRFGPLLRFTRPHWVGAVPLPMRRGWIEAGLREMFHDPSRIPADNYRAAADDVLATFKDPGYRLALLACARHLGAERAGGRRSYWTRLCDLEVPTYWIFGRRDRLVHHRYAEKVRSCLPSACVEMWDDVGHVPQFELPDRTNEAITGWLDRIEAGR